MHEIRRRRSVQPTRMLTALAVVWAIATAGASVLVDSHIAFRMPHVADLAADYAKKTDQMILAIGSSRTGEGLEVNRLTGYLRNTIPGERLTAFIATASGSGVATQEAILNALLAAGPKPQAVILEVNPEFLHAKKKWINLTRDATWSNLLDLGGEVLQKCGAKLAENRLLPLFARRFEVRRFLWRWASERVGMTPPKLDPMEPDVPILWTGFAPTPLSPEPMTDDLRSKQVRLAPPPLREFSPTGSAARALERMLAVCESRGVPVLMVNAALCSHSRQALSPIEREFTAYIDSLLRKHPLARFDDASAALPDAAFRDHHHANLYGRDLLCRRLAQNVLPAAFASWRKESPIIEQIARVQPDSESTTQ
jgi:hypothetical protein